MKSMSLRFRILLPVIGVIILIMLISGILSISLSKTPSRQRSPNSKVR